MPRKKCVAGISGSSVKRPGPLDNSVTGSRVKPCLECSRYTRSVKEMIRNGLLIIRVRYGIPYSELPDLEAADLGRYLTFLQGRGKVRPSVPFPRRQRPGENGLCDRLQRLMRHERYELALSVASIKRSFPKSCPHHTPSARPEWERNALSPPPPTSPEYMAHIDRFMTRFFRPGWDRNYETFVKSHLPNPSARKPLLSRADLMWMGRREEFFNACLEGFDPEGDRISPIVDARYKEVASAGKCRPLLIYDENVEFLAPLHKLIYSHLRREGLVLCGPPTEEVMTSLCVNEYQTSVDLVSATDGLSHDKADRILDRLEFTSVNIPRSVWRLAHGSLRPFFRALSGERLRVRHGQMMGSYLSFPLLCIQSRLMAEWATGSDPSARYLTNGDDVAISHRVEVQAEDYPDGARLNEDKTIRARDIVELNSTMFLRRGGRWREVRNLRRGGEVVSYSGMMHMAKACTLSPAWEAAFTRSRIGRRWGFLPSQLGHRAHGALQRERTMRRSRCFTVLPGQPNQLDDRLRCISGRDASAVEAEFLRDFLWENGRGGGMKRDVWNPSPGAIRRTYVYRAQRDVPPVKTISRPNGLSPRVFGRELSMSALKGDWKAANRKRPVFFLPEDCYTEEEMGGLIALERWRQAFASVTDE
nr:MAG: hypothetical protein [Botourmiaviridae sp.]